MKLWRVQYAYGVEIGQPAIHRQEEAAKGEAAYLLGNWLMKNLTFYARALERAGEHPEFSMDARAVVQQIPEMLQAGDVWGAYDVWQEFYAKYENEFEQPLFVRIGTVIVETREYPGPTRRVPLIPKGSQTPMEQYGQPGQIVGMREELEVDQILTSITKAVVQKLAAEGKQISENEFMEQVNGVIARVSQEAEASEEEMNFEELNQRMEAALKQHFGLSGPSRHPRLLRFS